MKSRHLLESNGSVSTHLRNLQALVKRMLKIRRGTPTPTMSDLFEIKRDPCYNLRNNDNFHIPSVNIIFNDLESISFPVPQHPLKDGHLRAAHVACAKYIYKILVFCREIKLGLFH